MDAAASERHPPSADETFLNVLAWVGGAFSSAFQPSRLVAGFVVALLLWLPGLGWDALVGRHVDPTGFTGVPYDDAEQAAVQATLRRLAAEYVPDQPFEEARVPADALAALLHARAATAPDAGARDALLVAAARVGSLVPLGSFEALLRGEALAAGLVVDGVLGGSLADMVAGLRMIVWDVPWAAWQRDPVFAVVYGLWAALCLAVGAGAIARMEAAQVAQRGCPGAAEGWRFAAGRWSDLVLAWLAPVAIAVVLALLCMAWGVLFRNEWTGWLGGVLYIVPLTVGAVAGLVLVVGALGALFAPCAVASDGLDALDASQRGAIYAIGRPGLWVAVVAVCAGVAAFGLVVLRIIGAIVTGLTAAAVSAGADPGSVRGGAVLLDALRASPDGQSAAWSGPGVAVAWWVALVSVMVAGAFLSLVWGLLTRGYLALRLRCDGQPREDIWPFELATDVADGPAADASSRP